MSFTEWLATVSTDDLRWHIKATVMEMPELVRVRDDEAECEAARHSADSLIAERTRACTAIAAELRRRGEQVDWEE